MSLIAIVALIFAQSPALRAETGWILWQKDVRSVIGGKPTNNEPVWTPLDGFADVKECRLQGERELKLLKILYQGLSYSFPLERERQVLLQKGDGDEMTTVRYLCFPAIFDPRK